MISLLLPSLWLSKMGGLLRSLDVLEQARAAKIGINIGAHVGATGLLTRAALTIAANADGCLLHPEGAFGTHLLERDVTVEPLMFGPGGVLDTGDRFTTAPGFGIDVAEDGLRSFL